MLYMVAHDLNIDKEIQWPIMENINQKLYAKYLSKLLFSKVEDDPQENINRWKSKNIVLPKSKIGDTNNFSLKGI